MKPTALPGRGFSLGTAEHRFCKVGQLTCRLVMRQLDTNALMSSFCSPYTPSKATRQIAATVCTRLCLQSVDSTLKHETYETFQSFLARRSAPKAGLMKCEPSLVKVGHAPRLPPANISCPASLVLGKIPCSCRGFMSM